MSIHYSRRAMLQALAAGAAVPLWAAEPMDATSARIQADLAKHAGFGIKRSGTPGDLMTADWIAQRLRSASYKVESLDFSAPFLVERATRLSSGGASVELVAQTPAATTGSKGVTGRLALVRTAADAAATQGKIAFVVLASARYAAIGLNGAGISGIVEAAAKAGALAAVLVTTGPTGEAILLNAPADKKMPLPVAILAPNKSKMFEEAAAKGAEATFILDGDATERNSKNVIGRLERGPRWIAISTPRSGWFHCVGERGTGTSVFLELAEWAVDRFPQHSIFLMNTGGHEYYFLGSHKVIHLAPPPQATDVWAHIGATIAARDAVEVGGMLKMLDTVDPQRSTMSTANLQPVIAATFHGMPELEKAGIVRPNAGELSSFTDLGYARAFAQIGVHRWFHTVKDTIDCVDGRLVTPALEAHKRTMERAVAMA